MRNASIDIGTNTILMLVGEIDDSFHITPINDYYEIPRLGKNVSVTKRLDDKSITRALTVLRRYKSLADEHKVDSVIALATSAAREAINGREFVGQVKNETGIEVEIVNGEREAYIGFIGAVSGSPYPDQPTLVVDIGGGSTELSFGVGLRPTVAKSMDVGAVRVTEKFFRHDPPNSSELEGAARFIELELSRFPFSSIYPKVIFGVAGTATTIALIVQHLDEFDLSAVTNYPLTVSGLKEVFQVIRNMSAVDILRLSKATEGRADVLVAGVLILMKVLEASNATELLTTDRGLRHGNLIRTHKHLLEK